VKLDRAVEAGRPYHALRSVRLMSVYPYVEGYKQHTAIGAQAEFSDPMGFHQFSLAGSVTPDEDSEDERYHAMARYRRFDVTATVRWNPGSFYDLVGATKSARKGFQTALEYRRSLIYDKPRTLDLTLGASYWTGLERLPNNQNISTGKDFDQLLNLGAHLRYKHLRSSIGAADAELGHQGWVGYSMDHVRFERATGRERKDFPFVDAGLDMGRPLPRVRNSSLWIRLAGGWAGGDETETFGNFYFGGFGNNGLDVGEPRRYRDPERFPGVEIDGVAAQHYARGMLELSLPAVRFRRAGALSLYASWARLSLFSTGLATNFAESLFGAAPALGPGGVANDHRELLNAGAQIDVRLQLLTQVPLTFSAGWAYAFERRERRGYEWMASLKVL
jgi:hypothetical protein